MSKSVKNSNKNALRNKRMSERFPLLFECIDNELYFIDKNITKEPLYGKRHSIPGMNMHVFSYYWGNKRNDGHFSSILLSKYIGVQNAIHLLDDDPKIPIESCIKLFEMNIEIGEWLLDNDTVQRYDKESLIRQYTIENIIE